MKICLNLGCGRDIRYSSQEEHWVNMDVAKLPGVDRRWDINKYPWPFQDSYFDLFYCSHVLEHVDDLLKCLEEIHRVAKKDAMIIVKVPLFPSIYAANDPTHQHFFTYFTFEYFQPEVNYAYYSKAKFIILKRRIHFSWNPLLKWMNFFVNLHPVFYSRYLSNLLPSNELYAELRAVKEDT